MMAARFVTRVRLVTVIFCVAALCIIGRLYVLQILHGQSYARRADAQVTVVRDPLLNRANIYFSDKGGDLVTAATLRPVDSASSTDHQRYYPGGSLAAQTVGFVAFNNDNEQKGRYGLERYYDTTLARSGENLYKNFFVELFGGIEQALSGKPSQGDIITTIEPTVQAELERTLSDYEDKWHAKLAGGIIMDPSNGEIVAMAVAPTFDLNSFNTQKGTSIFGNPMVESVFEMGSIIKPLTVAAGLDSGAITEQTTYNDTGCINVEDKKICNFDFKARGTIPIQEILSQSLNLGASFVATKMGPSTTQDYFLQKYKLGSETGIDLPGEVGGLMKNLQSGRPVELDTASFGQGIAMTPIETVRALASLGNGGFLVTPHIAKAVKEDSGVVRTLGWGEPEPILKPETSTAISRMLTKVVDTSLANGEIKIPNYSVAAKTGTAQIANPGGGGYYTDRFLHSFFGYFPSFSPRYVIFLFANEPQGAPYASQTWAHPFNDLVKFLINYYEIPPDR
jgi:stage V sporulation protein D (sporulation-specific penicillin-binding protein)